jgi:hypothetical protein
MTAPNLNNWNVSYSSITFFVRALRAHSKVRSLRRTRDILFHVELENEERITVLLVDEYVLGLAAIYRALDEFGKFDYIVTAGNWNGYTREAKEFGNVRQIGVFNTEEFFGALNWSDPKKYYKKDVNGKPDYAYKTA